MEFDARNTAALGAEANKTKELVAAYRDLQAEQKKLSQLNAVQTSLSAGGSTDIAAYRAVKAEIDASSAKVAGLSTQVAKGGGAGAAVDADAAATASTKAQEDAEKKAAEDAKDRKKALDAERSIAARFDAEHAAGLKAVGGAATGALSAIIKIGAAEAGVSGLADLNKLALGYRGVAQLQMISQRAQMDMRRLFVGLDASPMVNATGRLETNLSRSTVTGAALSGVLQRGFSTAYGLAERLEPVLSGAFQLGVLGALKLEEALLRTEVAAAPLIVLLEDFAASEAGVAASSAGVELAISAIGAAVTVVTTPIRDLITQLELLAAVKKAFDSGGEDQAGIARALGAQSNVEHTTTLDRAQPKAEGRATGGDIADGIVEGLNAKEAEVAAGGAKLAKAAIVAARTEAGAHSPADATIDLGHDLGDGAVVGMDQRRGAVQEAAGRSLVPDVAAAGRSAAQASGSPSAGASPSAAAGGPIQVTVQAYFPGITSGSPKDLEPAATAAFQVGIRQLAMMMGLPIAGGSST